VTNEAKQIHKQATCMCVQGESCASYLNWKVPERPATLFLFYLQDQRDESQTRFELQMV
jgi:hypothetical protein